MNNNLFRGKTEDRGVWVYGYFVNCASMYDDPETDRVAEIIEPNADRTYIGEYDPSNVRAVIPETVGRNSGCPDLNGNDIFEGDIIALTEDVKKTFDVEDGVVRYGRGGFYINVFNSLHSFNTLASYDWVMRGTVIGNIYDNPELLREKEARTNE